MAETLGEESRHFKCYFSSFFKMGQHPHTAAEWVNHINTPEKHVSGQIDIFQKTVNLPSMKTTIDIPDQVLSDAIRFTKAKTKKDAILTALEDFTRRQRVMALASSFGTWDMASNAEIEAADVAEVKQAAK